VPEGQFRLAVKAVLTVGCFTQVAERAGLRGFRARQCNRLPVCRVSHPMAIAPATAAHGVGSNEGDRVYLVSWGGTELIAGAENEPRTGTVGRFRVSKALAASGACSSQSSTFQVYPDGHCTESVALLCCGMAFRWPIPTRPAGPQMGGSILLG
jgi:hypothetical protein